MGGESGIRCRRPSQNAEAFTQEGAPNRHRPKVKLEGKLVHLRAYGAAADNLRVACQPKLTQGVGKREQGWRRGWDSNPAGPFRVCNLQKPRCRLARNAVFAVAHCPPLPADTPLAQAYRASEIVNAGSVRFLTKRGDGLPRNAACAQRTVDLRRQSIWKCVRYFVDGFP